MTDTNSTELEQKAQAALANPEAVDAAVSQSHAAAAPADAVRQQLAQHQTLWERLVSKVSGFEEFMTQARPLVEASEMILANSLTGAAVVNRVTAVEEFITQARPLVEASEMILANSSPTGAAVVNRMTAVEGFLSEFVALLNRHMPNLPTPPVPQPPAE